MLVLEGRMLMVTLDTTLTRTLVLPVARRVEDSRLVVAYLS